MYVDDFDAALVAHNGQILAVDVQELRRPFSLAETHQGTLLSAAEVVDLHHIRFRYKPRLLRICQLYVLQLSMTNIKEKRRKLQIILVECMIYECQKNIKKYGGLSRAYIFNNTYLVD